MSQPNVSTQLRFDDVKQLLNDRLKSYGFKPVDYRIVPLGNLAIVLKTNPHLIAAISVGGGAGFTKEQTFDRPFITCRFIGPQRDYDEAETFALACDDILTSHDSSGMVGNAYTLYITRTGGRPSLVDQDVADRYHLTCSYIAEAQSGR